jgi:probable rRNA maturation factor
VAHPAKVRFFFETKDFTLKNRSLVKSFIGRLFSKEGYKLESLNFIFCSDKRLLGINRQFFNHDFYTDVITFPISTGDAVVGEIYISTDRVRDNSSRLGVSFKDELHRVMIHGALHLCGYKDKKDRDIKTIRAREDYYLSLLKRST